MNRTAEDRVSSPCVSVCALDEQNVCKGCFRTSDEITFWTTFDNDKKREIVDRTNKLKQEKSAPR